MKRIKLGAQSESLFLLRAYQRQQSVRIKHNTVNRQQINKKAMHSKPNNIPSK